MENSTYTCSNAPLILPTRGRGLLRAAQVVATATGRGCGLWRLAHYGADIFPDWRQCPVQGPDGQPFYVDLRAGGFQHLVHGWSIQEIEPVIRDLPVDSVALDIGANIGIWTRLLSRKCFSGHVFAFEPSMSTYSLLKRNCSGQSNVTCIQSAVGQIDGSVSFAGDDVPSVLRRVTSELHQGVNVVPSVRLASWIKIHHVSRIDFVKVDVEGFEEDVLCSCIDELAARKTIIVFEFIPEFAKSRSTYRGEKLFSALETAGYVVYRLDKSGSRYRDHQSRHDWTNNYIAVLRPRSLFATR